MIADIVQRVQNAHEIGELPTMRINVMSINAWLEDVDIITPAEIGLVQFNLEEGVSQVLNQLVDPGPIPKGYRGDMKILSDKYHKIWMDNRELSDDYEGIMVAIRDFVTRDKSSRVETYAGEGITVEGDFQLSKTLIEEQTQRRIDNQNRDFLPIFVMPGPMKERCIRSLDWLALKAQVSSGIEMLFLKSQLLPSIPPLFSQMACEFTFFELPRLFYEILQVLSGASPSFANLSIPTLAIAEAHLNKDVLLYTPGVSCR